MNGSVLRETQIHRWRPPEQGFWKVNSDATTCLKVPSSGLGIIIRSADRSVCVAAAYNSKATFLPIVAEAMTVRRGIFLAIELGLVPFLIESNCFQVVQMIRYGDSFNGDVGPIISNVVLSLKSLPRCSIGFVPRAGNAVAHSLAKLAISFNVDRCWLDSFPPYVERSVLLDAAF
ncbi:hypothetical protein LWI29_007836 [Acer saccharum]|uniref:RNase H type-1 domain-containing protein n=1 Tax=Acer saccharum TaxID=4024 RepID=A0AA39T0S8_ACESA|nr:hypothetical protein LWI29_007836 [Acer saccharum]